MITQSPSGCHHDGDTGGACSAMPEGADYPSPPWFHQDDLRRTSLTDSYVSKDPSWHDGGGWTAMPNEILRDRSLSMEARGLMGYLASHSTEFKISMESLRLQAGVGRDKLYRMIRELEAAGYLKREPTFQVVDGMNRQGANRFKLRRTRETQPAENQQAEMAENPRSGQVTDFQHAGSQQSGNQQAIKKTNIKKTKEQELSITADAATPPTKIKNEPVGFDEFWLACPRKVGKDAARRAYVKAVRSGFAPELIRDKMITAARFWKASRTEQRFIPHPATWLNSGRYEDPDQTLPSSRHRSFVDATGAKWDM